MKTADVMATQLRIRTVPLLGTFPGLPMTLRSIIQYKVPVSLKVSYYVYDRSLGTEGT